MDKILSLVIANEKLTEESEVFIRRQRKVSGEDNVFSPWLKAKWPSS